MPARRLESAVPVGLLVLVVLAVGVLGWLAGWRLGADSAVYRAGALTFLHGDPLYDPQRLGALPSWVALPFTYPPAAALLFVPLAAMPAGLVWGAVSAASVLSLAVVIRVCARPRALAVTGLTVCALALEPVWKTLFLGQINLILLALVIVDVLVLGGSHGTDGVARSASVAGGGGRRVGGLLTGVAAAVKLTPLIFVAHLFVTGRARDGFRALGTFFALQALMFTLAPSDAIRYWTEAAFDPKRVGGVHWIFNQSLNGWVSRATEDAPWAMAVALLIGAALAVPAVWLVRRLHRRGETLAALLVTAFLGLLVSPVSWSHHWVWAVPLIALLAVRGWWLWAAAVAALFVSCVVMLVPNGGATEFGWGPGRSVLGNAYVLAAALGILGMTARELRRTRQRESSVL
ncbi:MAG TPA: glycosyltransferase 87 family protein [Amycolatopsis sp.]|uniref:glycosyltransferase 87 family protein n=1 Tax=Amycolatopsis sp. TaxID=37632 RepID=UPI002B4692E9|nr:glycosyltransferase 87 family protein [Amycolatopsis sp.]HKS46071.1 glycosyltransferase 87 family protein [Amycolatopsis sp.]